MRVLFPLSLVAGVALLVLTMCVPFPHVSLAQNAKPQSNGASWGGIQWVTIMRGPKRYYMNQRSLWAVQKTPATLAPQKFNVHLWFNKPIQPGDLKIVFHSRFIDGSPCGTWEDIGIKTPTPRGSFDATGFFHAPVRAGTGILWCEVQNRRGQIVGKWPKTNFTILPLTLSCGTDGWKTTGLLNEWARKIYVTALPERVPVIRAAHSPSYAIAGVPVRLAIVAPMLANPRLLSRSRLSATTGKTQVPRTGGEASFVVTQTATWKPGNSNQLDTAQVAARIDFSLLTANPPKGNNR